MSMTNQQGAPEALTAAQIIARFEREDGYRLEGAVPREWALEAYNELRRIAALVEAQQPAPSAAETECVHEWDGLARTSMPPKYACKHCHNFFDAPPSPTPQADSVPAEAVQRIVHLRADRERRVYVAGPMTGLPGYNFPLFNATAARLRSEGWHVENPAEHGHVDGAGWSDYLRWDISRIATCGAIYLLPGWSKSKGATLEVHIAGVLGLQVLLADGAEAPQADSQPAPIDMVLHCPKCGLQHIDTPEKVDRRLAVIDPPAAWAMDPWNNPPHRSHLCHSCGHIWRPADVPTNGVAAVKTTGKADSPIAARAPADSVTAPAGGVERAKLANRIKKCAEHWAYMERIDHGDQAKIEQGRHAELVDALAATPPAQADSVLEDAARLEQRSQPSGSEGMTIAGNGASELGKLMREQRALRGGIYPDGNPNAARKQGGKP